MTIALVASPAVVAKRHGPAVACKRLCARSADGMMYRILGEFRYRDVIGNRVQAFAFTVSNRSKRAEVFEPVPGFTAVLNTGGEEQITNYEGPSRADRSCASPTATEPNGITPFGYRVKAGQTRGPLEVCMELSPGQRLTRAQFADDNQDLHRNAVIPLTGRIPRLRSPLPLVWPLPNPCKLPPKALVSFVGVGTTVADTKLQRRDWNTSTARATCIFYPQFAPPFSTTYVGYVAPPKPSGKVFKIPGWPKARLVDSTEPISSQNYFWEVTFKRKYRGHTVWGQTWWRGPQCTPGDPADAAIAKALYDKFAVRPPISVPKPHHVKNKCDGV